MSLTSRDKIEELVLADIASNGTIKDSKAWCATHGVDHDVMDAVVKSLVSDLFVEVKTCQTSVWTLSKEAEGYLKDGTPEVQVYRAIGKETFTKAQLKEKLGALADIGVMKATSNRWIAVTKKDGEAFFSQKADSIKDEVGALLASIKKGEAVADKQLKDLKKRNMVVQGKSVTLSITKGGNFQPTREKLSGDLSMEQLASGAWETQQYKKVNIEGVRGKQPDSGALHPLMKVRTQFREIFLELGFEEMPTNNFIESSFWNFDALFQPQQHPARDMHDTFFLSEPAQTLSWPEDYVARVKEMHERGGSGSIGHRYDWSTDEARKNLLRTHTTAVSSRMLYALAQQEEFTPKKYFSIDRVFRNETTDATHLAEFHQVEGLIADRNVSLGDLIGVLNLFFQKLGIKKLRFKPAYNPYTEPSMEIFSYSEELEKWLEVGNSGVFRPEMLRPMGLPEDVGVIAWGLSLERPTMIKYGIGNIRDLLGHKVNLKMIKDNPLCDITLERTKRRNDDEEA